MGSAVLTVMLVSLIGVGSRLLRFPPVVALLLQTAGVAAALTSIFTSAGYGGVIPNAATVREVAALLSGAVDQIAGGTAPVPSTPELAFLIAVSLGVTAVIVDFFVAEAGAPALAGLPLLCLYSVPAGLADQLLPWWTFAVPAGCYAVLLVVIRGHDGSGLRPGWGGAASTSMVIALAVAGSVVMADAVTPVGTGGRLEQTAHGGQSGTIGLSPFAGLHGDLQLGEAREVLEVSGLPEPDYLRTTALETWDAEEGFTLTDPVPGARPADTPLTVAPLVNNPEAQQAVVTVRVLNFNDRFLPMYQGSTTIDGLADGYSYNPALGAVFTPEATRPADYQLTVAYGGIDPARLRADSVTPTPALVSADGIGAEATALARSVTAPGRAAFDKALLLNNYFTDPTGGFEYSLQVPTGNSGNLLTDFLQNKQGYCEQYAAAMTVMLRSLDIPARVAVGFTQGTRTPSGSYLVTSHNAHAWVEVRFDSSGWVRFDPTPLSDSVGGQQGFRPDTAAAPPTQIPTTDIPTEAPATVDNPVPSGPAAADSDTRPVDDAAQPGAGRPATWTWALPLAAAMMLAALAWPSWWRRRRAQRHVAAAARGGPAAADAAWEELLDLTVDYDLPCSDVNTARQTANQLARAARLGPSARASLKRITLAAESSWYSAHDDSPDTTTDLADDVRQIARDLRESARQSWRHRLIPRSFIRATRRHFPRTPRTSGPNSPVSPAANNR